MTPDPIWHRVYADFLMPSRLGDFRRLLESALKHGYALVSIEMLWKLIQTDNVDPAGRYIVLRHDIDTDPGTGEAMWNIEKALGGEASYFFRLSTVDWRLMARITEGGASIGYHYEELATVAKERRLRTREQALRSIPEAQERFAQNLDRMRTSTGQALRVVAAHGDFVNRRLGIANWAILADPAFRREVRVDLEAYDGAFMDRVASRHSDTHYPRFWIPGEPRAAIASGVPIVYLLVHPRHWRVNRMINARDDLGRLRDSILYRRPTRSDGLAAS